MERQADGVRGPADEPDTFEEVLPRKRRLPLFDATPVVGLKTRVCASAIEHTDEDGNVTIELPKQRQLLASAAVLRCLMEIRLRGREIRALRKILGLAASEFAKELDGKTAPETISRWENEAQPIGSFAEKVLRLLVCEELREEAPGISYEASKIAHLRISDPWLANKDYELPYIYLVLTRVKEQSGSIIDAWDVKKAA